MKYKRLCIITECFYSIGGGVTSFTTRLARALGHKGFSSLVVTRRVGYNKCGKGEISELPVHALPPTGNHALLKYFFLPVLFLWLVVNRWKYDAMLVAGCRVTGIPSVVVANLLRKPCFLRPAATGEISGSAFLQHPLVARASFLRAPIKLLIHLRNKLFASGAACYVAISDNIENELLQAGFPPHKIVRITNGVPSNEFVRPSPDARRRISREMNLDPSCLHAVYVGTLAPRKRVEILLEAWAERRQCGCRHKLLLVGPTQTQEYQDQLKDLACTLRIQHSVRFMGHANDVRPFLAVTDVFMMASRWEGMSNALLEAMACGLVPIATDVSGASEVIKPGVNGFLIPKEGELTSDFASVLSELLHDAERCRNLGRSARRTIEKSYSFKNTAAAYVDLFKKYETKR